MTFEAIFMKITYSTTTKLRAVHDYRNHRLPTKEILLKYDIRGLSQLRNWVILYNNGKEPVRKRVRKMGRKVSGPLSIK